MDAAPVAKYDVLWKPRRDPVHTRHHGLHNFHIAQVGEGGCGVSAGEGKDPEIDCKFVCGMTRDTDDPGFRGEIGQELWGEIFVDTNTHHSSSLHEITAKGKLNERELVEGVPGVFQLIYTGFALGCVHALLSVLDLSELIESEGAYVCRQLRFHFREFPWLEIVQ